MDDVLRRLLETTEILARIAATVTAEEARARAPAVDGGFSLLEHAWHLADLERDAFALRIGRILTEERPWLPDFEGGRIARERNYRARELGEAVVRFREARGANVIMLHAVMGERGARVGVQEGVGAITLAELPFKMAEHDASHLAELGALFRVVAPRLSTLVEHVAAPAHRAA